MKSVNANSVGQRPVLAAIRAVVIGTFSGAVMCAVLLALCSLAFVSSENVPHGFLQPFIITISVLSSFFAGYVTARLLKQRGLIVGMVSGLLLFLLFFLSGLVLSQNHSVTSEAAVRFLIMLISGGIGGLLAVSRKSRRK